MLIGKKEIREKMIKGKILNPLLDCNFKALFADESPEGNRCLSGFLESIIGKQVLRIKILRNEPVSSQNEKSIRFDISCSFNDGEEAEIEIQTRRMDDNFVNRSVYYMIRGHRDRLQKGQKYSSLKKYYQINITDFNVIDNQNVLNHFQLRNPSGFLLTDVFNVYYLELSKLQCPDKFSTEQIENLKEYEKWGIFLKYSPEEKFYEFLDKIIDSSRSVKMAQEKLYRMSLRERLWRRQWAREKSRYTIWSWKQAAIQKGLEEGREKGLEEGREQGIAQGIEQGITQGIEQGITQGIAQGIEEGIERGRRMQMQEDEQRIKNLEIQLKKAFEEIEELKLNR